MIKLIAVVVSWVSRLWPFARNPSSHASQIAQDPTSEPLAGTPDEAGLDTGQPQEEHTSRDALSNNKTESKPLVYEPASTDSSSNDAKPSPNHATTEACLSLPDADSHVKKPCDSDKNPPIESSAIGTRGDNEVEHPPPNANKRQENGAQNNSTDGATQSRGIHTKQRKKPRHISGRRGRKPGNMDSNQRESLSVCPELICRRVPATRAWEIVLVADEKDPIAAVHLDEESLESTDRQCRVNSLYGSLTVSSHDGREQVITLFDGDPLIFKLRNGWRGEGRKTSKITNGHFIVIVPKSWERIDRAPVEPDGCVDPEFLSHYFYRDATTSVGSENCFRGWNGSLVATGITLTGKHIYDDSDEGLLFVGNPPTLETPPEIEWALIGYETSQGWVEAFRPNLQSLQETLASREGHFFLRIYDEDRKDNRKRDSEQFRFVPVLTRIAVDGAEYTHDTVLVPKNAGYSRTEVRFIGADGSTLTPTLPPNAQQVIASTGAVVVSPHPEADRILCSLGSGVGTVDLVLDLPRIWWRLEGSRLETDRWCDKPIKMNREEFKTYAKTDVKLVLLSKREASVRIGFDDESYHPYQRKTDEDTITIPLVHFVDHVQIDQRLRTDARLTVKSAGVVVALVIVSADPIPEIVSFTAEPTTVLAGEEATLKWTTRNTDEVRASIEPVVGVVESSGTHTVRPTETTHFTLTLTASGENHNSRPVTVTVKSPPLAVGQLFAMVMSRTGGWRVGKGFSIGELREAGLTVCEATDRSIPVDRRRRTSHGANVEATRNMLDG